MVEKPSHQARGFVRALHLCQNLSFDSAFAEASPPMHQVSDKEKRTSSGELMSAKRD